jgi:3-hydroxyisobutyrate dehydrogenase
MEKKVGFIGLGIMGLPMARNLIKAGYKVVAYNRTAARCEPVVAEGAERAATPREVARQSPVVITIVSDTPDVESVILGKDGVIEGIARDAVVIDMSTISPEATRKIAARLRERGAHLLDAPVSGGEQGAVSGALSIMVGGEAKIFERCRPILEAMGQNITHVGANGMGQTVKLMNQILVAGNLNAVVEALIFANKAGVDLEKAVDAIKNGAAGSWQLTNIAPRIIARDFRPGFMIDLMQKDLNLVMATADAAKTPLPVASFIHQIYYTLQAAGEGRSGTQALVKAYERLSGTEVQKDTP